MSKNELLKGFIPPRGFHDVLEVDPVATSRWQHADAVREALPFDPDEPGSILLGYLPGKRRNTYLGIPIDDRHGITIAGARAGKGASFIIPNLLFYPGSVIANDPKGELARVT